MKIKDMNWEQCLAEAEKLENNPFQLTDQVYKDITVLEGRIEIWTALNKRMEQLLHRMFQNEKKDQD